jgi:hypothetical protein
MKMMQRKPVNSNSLYELGNEISQMIILKDRSKYLECQTAAAHPDASIGACKAPPLV